MKKSLVPVSLLSTQKFSFSRSYFTLHPRTSGYQARNRALLGLMCTLACGIAITFPARPVQAQPTSVGNDAQDLAAQAEAGYLAMEKQVATLQDQNPQSALEKTQEYRKQFPGEKLGTHHLICWASVVYNVAYSHLKKPELALPALDEVLERPLTQESYSIVSLKAELLLQEKRPQDAETLLKAYWPQAKTSHNIYAAESLLPRYITALETQKKSVEAKQLRFQAVADFAGNFGESQWLTQQLIDSLLGEDESQALGWAKLHYQACPFDDKAMTASTQLLAKVWTATDMTPAKAQAFIKAQNDETAPNPLKDVKRPTVNEEALRAALAENPGASKQRVTLMLMLGDMRGAMVEARRMLLEYADSPDGLSEICRVFKAADLNVMRANAFLEFYKNGQGPNPVTGFLQEYKDQPK